VALPARGCGTRWTGHQTRRGVIKLICRRSALERRAVEGNGPVSETYSASAVIYPAPHLHRQPHAMFLTPGKLSATLVIYIALVLTLSVCSEAKALLHRDHANLKRIIRKRVPPVLVPVAGAGAAPTITTSTGSTLVTPPSSSASQTATPGSVLASDTTKSSSTSTSESSSSSASATSDSSTVTQTSTSTSTQPSTTSSTPTGEPTNATPVPNTVSAALKPTVTRTESVDPTMTSTGTPVAQSGSSKTKNTALMVIVIVASCVAGVAILWTVFRKWKLGRSSKFDERLQPIDWHPTGAEDTAQRRFSSGASSLHSGVGHGNSAGRSVDAHSGPEHGHGIPNRAHQFAIPDHDFTAGPSTLTAVGGYADLARGPSPQPQMHQISHSPNVSPPTYNTHLPLYHQAGYRS
jgi:hypothetical protein